MPPSKYSSKPVLVDAILFEDDNSANDIVDWLASEGFENVQLNNVDDHVASITIVKPEGSLVISLGYFVVRNSSGEFSSQMAEDFYNAYNQAPPSEDDYPEEIELACADCGSTPHRATSDGLCFNCGSDKPPVPAL